MTGEEMERAIEFLLGHHAKVSADRDQFVDWLLDQVRWFRSTPQAQIALVYLSPAERDRMDGPWRGTWVLRIFWRRS